MTREEQLQELQEVLQKVVRMDYLSALATEMVLIDHESVIVNATIGLLFVQATIIKGAEHERSDDQGCDHAGAEGA